MSERWSTPLTPGRPNDGAAIAKVQRLVTGSWPMPWQRHSQALTTERLPSGEWAYDTVITTVPRQAGKTTSRGAVALTRCWQRPMARCWFTAQKRQDARDILIGEVAPRWKRSPLSNLAKVRESQGSEGFYFTNGSSWRVFAPAEDALHGKANELVDVDELWAFTPTQGAELEQAIIPTFTTTGGQFSGVSTAGTSASTWMEGYVLKGRAAVEAGERTGVAYVEWSLPDDLALEVRAGLEQEPDSPEWLAAIDTLARHHPAYGYTLRPRAIAQFAKLPKNSVDGVLRAYGNVWTGAINSLISPTVWTARGWPVDLGAPSWPSPTGPVALAFEVSIDRADAAIVAAWVDAGVVHLDVIAHQPGADWLADQVEALRDAWHPVSVGHDGAGPVLEVADVLTRRGVDLVSLKASQYAVACQGLVTDVKDGGITHAHHGGLDAAVAAVVKRPLLEGGWAFGRLLSGAPIAPAVAAAVARYLVLHPEPEQTKPSVGVQSSR